MFSKRSEENGKTKAGRSSEQLIHIHIAKIAICPCFCKLIFNKTLINETLMLGKGQIIGLNHKARQFAVTEASSNIVRITFVEGHPYDVCRNGDVFDCNFRNTGRRVLLRQSKDKRGYKLVNVRACNESVQIKVHRLVALCFLSNPHNLPIVNHKDENPANNHASNLEWCDQKYNVNYSLSKMKAGCLKRDLSMNTKLTKDKVRAMMPKDCLFIPCDNAAECESVYQTALQTKRELGDNGNIISVSKSNVTLSVVVRTGLSS